MLGKRPMVRLSTESKPSRRNPGESCRRGWLPPSPHTTVRTVRYTAVSPVDVHRLIHPVPVTGTRCISLSLCTVPSIFSTKLASALLHIFRIPHYPFAGISCSQDFPPLRSFSFSRSYLELLLIRHFTSRLLWPLLTSARSAQPHDHVCLSRSVPRRPPRVPHVSFPPSACRDAKLVL